MDYVKVLKRAWEITWRYRALWIFGIIVALVTAGRPPGDGGGDGVVQYNLEDWPPQWEEFRLPEIPAAVGNALIVVGIGLVCLMIILSIAAAVARYVAETALIRMVDDHEETGEKRGIREGFRLGWSRTAWRLFLINLLIDLPTVVAFILLFLLAGGLVALSIVAIEELGVAVGVIGIVAAIGLFFLIIFLAIVIGAVLSLLKRFFHRACALEELGVIESIRRGFGVVRQNLKDVAIMWLIMIGVGIGLAIAMIILAIVLIPAILLLIVVGGVLGGLPALLVGGLTSLFLEGPVVWVLAAVVGLPIFILVVAAPWVFLGGLIEVFKSSVWTLTYRELQALESLELEALETGADPLSELDMPDSG